MLVAGRRLARRMSAPSRGSAGSEEERRGGEEEGERKGGKEKAEGNECSRSSPAAGRIVGPGGGREEEEDAQEDGTCREIGSGGNGHTLQGKF